MPAFRHPALGVLGLLVLLGFGAGCGDSELGASIVRTGPQAGPTEPPPSTVGDPSTAVDATTSEAPQACVGARLAASLGAARPTADGVAQELILQNTGDAPCLMRGFPAVTAVAGNEGTPVGAQALPLGERGVMIRLDPRAAATVPLEVADVGAYDAAVCRPEPVRGLKVLPPGGSGGVFVPREGLACAADPLTPPQMTVGTAVAR